MNALPTPPIGATPLPQPKAGNAASALRLAGAGLHVFPCDPSDKPTKKSLLGGILWREQSTDDAETVSRWWRRWPDAIIGIDVGKTGLVVVDADRHPGAPDGVAAIKEILGKDLTLLGCPIVRTAGNGLHLIFAQPAGAAFGNSRGSIPPGVDIRGVGGYVIAVGSTRLDGARWSAVPGTADLATAFQAGAIPTLPSKIADLIRQRPEMVSAPATEAAQAAPLPKNKDVGERERAFAAAALERNAAELAACGAGGRNELLNKIAFRMARMAVVGWIDATAIRAALRAACEANGYLRDKGRRAFDMSFTSGMVAGAKSPHGPLEDRPANDDAKYRAAGDETARRLIEGRNGTVYDGDTGEIMHDAGRATHFSQAKAEPKWGEPKPIHNELPPVPAFDPAFLPDTLSPWVADIADRMQCPPDFVGVSVLVAIGALVGRKVAIRPQRKTDWFEVANLWGCIVGQPGMLKSPAMNEALKPLNKLEAEARKENEEALAEFRRAERVHELKVKAAEKATSRMKADEITDDMLAGDAPKSPRMRRYIVTDCT